ncbi:MAG TPA: site-2 protease family protein [Abditibacteriaceae bacterium]
MSQEIYTFIIVLAGWIFSVCLHEWAHAFVAYQGGDTTVKDKGYLSFNPLKYTDPFLSIVLPIVFLLMGGLGLPGGAVYIESHLLKSKWWDTMVSLAGPAANVILALVLVLILRFIPPAEGAQPALAFLALLQVTAVLFNMIPFPGFDGFGALRPHLDAETQHAAASFGMFGFIGVILLMQIPAVFNSFWGVVQLICLTLGLDPHLINAGIDQFTFWR